MKSSVLVSMAVFSLSDPDATPCHKTRLVSHKLVKTASRLHYVNRLRLVCRRCGHDDATIVCVCALLSPTTLRSTHGRLLRLTQLLQVLLPLGELLTPHVLLLALLHENNNVT